ncbi:MAG: hypothetical protein H0W83_07840, partial [Planctomycetes bacterium]|nr:hypothetical protein [Planctomycetota bacterium]
MPALPVTRFARVAIAGWDCITAAGDARASWDAVDRGQTALRHEVGIGWCGRLPADVPSGLAAAAERALTVPLRSIAGLDGPTAWSISTSKGDPLALDEARSGRPERFIDAIAGNVG